MFNRSTVLFFIFLSTTCLSQEKLEYVIDFDQIEYPVYYEGEAEYFVFSKRGDTIRTVLYENSFLIDRVEDTIILFNHFNGVRVSTSKYSFQFKNDVEYFHKKEFLNFPDLCKLFFIKKNENASELKLSRRKYIGEEEMGWYGKIDTLFSYSERLRTRTTKNFKTSKKIFNINSSIKNIDFFAFFLNTSFEHRSGPDVPDNPPDNPDGTKFKPSFYTIEKTNGMKIGLVRIKGHNLFDLIVSEERRLSTSRNTFKSSLSRRTYRKKTVNSEILNKFKIE